MSRASQGQKFEANDEQRELVAFLAAGGIPHKWIARGVMHQKTGLPISEPTLRGAFKAELAEGGWIGKAKLVSTAFDLAVNKANIPMTIFLLKVRMGWREQIDVNNSHTYAELVEAASKPKADPAAGPALGLIRGGKA